mgnify:FL=1
MTLAELAALAAKVDGFERPTVVHCDDGCDGCDDRTWVFDDSPAALLMAVWMLPYKITRTQQSVTVERYCERIRGFYESADFRVIVTQEDAARAALVALLRAHGGEVQDA